MDLNAYLTTGEDFESLQVFKVFLSKFEGFGEDVWYCGGGGGSFVGKPSGWTIFMGLNLVAIGEDEDTRGWLTWVESCTGDCGVCSVGWFVCVIVIRFALLPAFDGAAKESKSNAITSILWCY